MSSTCFQHRAKVFLKLGFSVLMINYRGSIGNGDRTLQSILGNVAKVSISSTYYEELLGQNSSAKKLQSQTVTREKLRKRLSYEKGLSKMLMKLTLWRLQSNPCWEEPRFLVRDFHWGKHLRLWCWGGGSSYCEGMKVLWPFPKQFWLDRSRSRVGFPSFYLVWIEKETKYWYRSDVIRLWKVYPFIKA